MKKLLKAIVLLLLLGGGAGGYFYWQQDKEPEPEPPRPRLPDARALRGADVPGLLSCASSDAGSGRRGRASTCMPKIAASQPAPGCRCAARALPPTSPPEEAPDAGRRGRQGKVNDLLIEEFMDIPPKKRGPGRGNGGGGWPAVTGTKPPWGQRRRIRLASFRVSPGI
jgi:hypothetical protein